MKLQLIQKLSIGFFNQCCVKSFFSVKSNNLVHETQKERGATAVFLGSKGEKFKNELANQRLETDNKKNENIIIPVIDKSGNGNGSELKNIMSEEGFEEF